MATLEEIFGKYTQPQSNTKVTGADFLSGIGYVPAPAAQPQQKPKSTVNTPIDFAALGIPTTTGFKPVLDAYNASKTSSQTEQVPFVQRDVQAQPQQIAQQPVVQPVITIADMYRDVALPAQDTATDEALALGAQRAKKQATERIDENRIREDIMSQYQAEIDALNRVYAEQLAQARQMGLGALGSARAIQARSGTLGSDFASAQTQRVQEQNLGIERLIQGEQQAKIASILGQARKQSAEEIAAKRQALQEGLQSYIQYLGAQTERRQSKVAGLVQALIDQGIRPDEISPQQIQEIAKSYGVSEQEIFAAYAARQNEATQGGESFTLSEGQTRYAFNPTTGQYEAVAASAKTGTGKLTDSQAKAATFAARMSQANTIIDEIGSQFTGVGSLVGERVPNILATSDRQRFEQAKRNFINAVLRRESGAVISDQEFENAEKQYFPQPGDGDAVLEQKRQNRQTALLGMVNESGGSLGGSTVSGFEEGSFAEMW